MNKRVQEDNGHDDTHVNPNYARWLLEAIHKIQSHKQGPSAERICTVVHQLHNVSVISATKWLELASQDGSVIKVDNKGLCSYHDPARKLGSHHTLHINKNTDPKKYSESVGTRFSRLQSSINTEDILVAIHKIKQQKQLPNVERIFDALRQDHVDALTNRLELAFKDGSVVKVYHDGSSSYHDPTNVHDVIQLPSRTLHINKKTEDILVAIHKIKQQKQLPNVERIFDALRQDHVDALTNRLELAVKDGSVIEDYHEGSCSYHDPASVSQLPSHCLHINKKTDFTKYILRTIKTLGEIGGSTMRAIKKYLRSGYTFQFSNDVDFTRQVKIAVKKAVSAGIIEQGGRNYKVCFSADSVDTATAEARQFGNEELQDMALVNKNKARSLENMDDTDSVMPSIKWSVEVAPSPSRCTVARAPAEQENSSEVLEDVPSMVEDKSSLVHIKQEHFSEGLKPKDGSSMLKRTVFTAFGEQVKEDKEGSLVQIASLSRFKNCSEEQDVLCVIEAKPCKRTHIDHVEENLLGAHVSAPCEMEVKSAVDQNLLGASENTDYKYNNVIDVKPIEGIEDKGDDVQEEDAQLRKGNTASLVGCNNLYNAVQSGKVGCITVSR